MTDSTQLWPSSIPLPLPVVEAICRQLKDIEADGTVAAIQGLSQSCHEVATPILYGRICLDKHSTEKLFGLWSEFPRKELHLACQSAEDRQEQETAHHIRLSSHLRLRRVLEYIQHITLDDFVSDTMVSRLYSVAQSVNSLHDENIFSGLSTVTFSERFMRTIPREQWRNETADRSNINQLRVLMFSPPWKEACFHWPAPAEREDEEDHEEDPDHDNDADADARSTSTSWTNDNHRGCCGGYDDASPYQEILACLEHPPLSVVHHNAQNIGRFASDLAYGTSTRFSFATAPDPAELPEELQAKLSPRDRAKGLFTLFFEHLQEYIAEDAKEMPKKLEIHHALQGVKCPEGETRDLETRVAETLKTLEREVHKTYEYRSADNTKGMMQERFNRISWIDRDDAQCSVCHGRL